MDYRSLIKNFGLALALQYMNKQQKEKKLILFVSSSFMSTEMSASIQYSEIDLRAFYASLIWKNPITGLIGASLPTCFGELVLVTNGFPGF